MKATAIKVDLLSKIEQSNVQQLKEIYGLVVNYLNKHEDTDEWAQLSLGQREKIEKGMREADNHSFQPLNQVTERLRKKYRVNG